MDFIKCSSCGKYEEPVEVILYGVKTTPDKCLHCLENEQSEKEKYDAVEQGFASRDDYLNEQWFSQSSPSSVKAGRLKRGNRFV